MTIFLGPGDYFFGLSNSSNYLGLLFGGASWGKFKTNTPATFFVGNLVYVVLTYNGLGATTATNFKAYLNNVDTAFDNAGEFAAPPNTLNTIGARNDRNSATFFNGSQNDHAIYNRALTADEVLQNFNATRSKYGI